MSEVHSAQENNQKAREKYRSISLLRAWAAWYDLGAEVLREQERITRAAAHSLKWLKYRAMKMWTVMMEEKEQRGEQAEKALKRVQTMGALRAYAKWSAEVGESQRQAGLVFQLLKRFVEDAWLTWRSLTLIQTCTLTLTLTLT